MKCLIVRFSAIGDCVMASHVPSRIRRTLAEAEIGWAIETRCSDVVDTEMLCQHVHPIPRHVWRKQRWSPKTWRAAMAYYASLRREQYSLGLDLQGHSKTAICLRLAKPKRRLALIGTDMLARRLNPVMSPLEGTRHCVELALHCLSQVFESTADSSPIVPKLSGEHARIQGMLTSGKPLATIAVNAGQWDKAYPLDRWQQVGSSLLDQGFQVAFLGGPESKAPDLVGSLDWVGQLTLAESMAAIDASAVHLAGDTGAGHLAAAYRTPVVSVFGPTDPQRFRPYTDCGIVLREGLATENVTVEQVLAAVEQLMETHGRKVSG